MSEEEGFSEWRSGMEFHPFIGSMSMYRVMIYNLQFKHLADALNPERLTMTG